MSNTDLRGADLSKKGEQEINLKKVKFTGANLSSASLMGANLQRAYLGEAQLQGAGLQRAQLQGADLSSAKLQGADMENAKTLGANFSNAALDGVYFKKIDNTTRDKIDWEKLAFEESATVQQRVESAQDTPPALPDPLLSKPEINAFIEMNKELALTDSYIAQAFLRRGRYYHSDESDIKNAYGTIADHIRTELAKDEKLRQEIIERGRGGLLKPLSDEA